MSMLTVALRVPARVLEHGLQDSLGEISLDADTHQPRRLLDRERQAAFGREPGAGRNSILCDRECICGAAPRAGLEARGSHECVDRTRQLLGVPLDELERRPILVGFALAAQSKLCLCEHACKRCTQLMRELSGEALLPAQARREPVEKLVER